MLSHRKLAPIFILSALFVAFVTSSFSFAQNRAANDGYPFRETGVTRQIAGFQNAVEFRWKRSVFETEAGEPCRSDCFRNGETGVARRYDVKVIGPVDDRTLPAATAMSAAERQKYSSIGRIECPTGRLNPKTGNPLFVIGTAFHVGSRSTMVTSAHSFVDPDTGAKVNPSSCHVSYYDYRGVQIEQIQIQFVRSRWDEPGKFGDVSNDIALIKLAGESTSAKEAANTTDAEPLTRLTSVTSVGFQLDLPNQTVMTRVHGVAIRPPNKAQIIKHARDQNLPLNNPENVAVVSYDANHGTSGAPVFNSQGKIIGIHQGYFGAEKEAFGMYTSYNRVMMFDKRFTQDMADLIAGR